MTIEPGQTHVADYPFIREVYSYWEGSNGTEEGETVSEECWKPGVKFELRNRYMEDGTSVAHGMGKIVHKVVALCSLPRPYPTRVFYIRTWISPDGRAFGKNKLRVTTLEAFNRAVKGYRYEIEVVEDLTDDERIALLAGKAA